NEVMGGKGDTGNGVIFEGTKGKMMCGVYGQDPQLLPTSRTNEVHVPQKYPRVPGGADGHYGQWVEACLAGYGNMQVDSPFVEYAVPLTQSILMANLAIAALITGSQRLMEKTSNIPDAVLRCNGMQRT